MDSATHEQWLADTRRIAWPTVFAVMPGCNLPWRIHDTLAHPINRVSTSRAAIAAADPKEVPYSDVNELAVLGQTMRRVIPS